MSKNKKTIEDRLEEAEVPREVQPYQLHNNWVWTQLGLIGNYYNGKAFKSAEWSKEGRPIIRIQDLTGTNKGEPNYFKGEVDSRHEITKGDLLISWSATLGVYIWNGPDAVLNQHIFKVKSHINKKYHYYAVQNLINALYSNAQGSGMVHVTKKVFNSTPIPLPPLNEQKRIADKVESLLNKIDEAKQLIEEAKESFELRRAAILDKAFRGELTQHWRESGSFSKSDILTYEVKTQPFKLPVGWRWVQLEDLVEKVFDGPFGSNLRTADYTDEGVRVIRLENIGRLSFDNTKRTYISYDKYSKLEKHTLIEGDIIFSSFISDKLRVCSLPQMNTKVINKADCFSIRPKSKKINKDYLLYFLSSNTLYKLLQNIIHGATRPRINLKQLKSLPIPVPPYDEQLIIAKYISKVINNEINAYNQMSDESSLQNLKKAILSKAFRGELGTNDSNEESAIELLIEVLQEQ